jgi:protein gp37
MADWAEGRPEQAPHLERLWELILETRSLNWLMLTKRPQLITKLCPLRSQRIWQGTTAETQQWLDLRWKQLSQVDSEIYWLSIEPMFEALTLPEDFLSLGQRAWVICGGESGPHARTMDPAWARTLRDQCLEAGVAFHMKQMSGNRKQDLEAIPSDLMIRQYPVPRTIHLA